MALSEVQFKPNTGTGSTASLTLDATTVSGNLVVIRLNSDATASLPSGWTAGPSAVDFCGTYMFYRTNFAGTAISVTLGASSTWALDVREYSGNVTSSVLDKSGSATPGTLNAVNLTVSTSGSTTQADELALVGIGLFSRNGSGWSFTQSFSLQAESNSTHELGTASKDLAATGTISTQASWTGGSDHPGAVIATFKAAAVASPGPSLNTVVASGVRS